MNVFRDDAPCSLVEVYQRSTYDFGFYNFLNSCGAKSVLCDIHREQISYCDITF
jgi:hypothetical protein